MNEQAQEVSQHPQRKRWLLAAAPVVAVITFGSAAWACVPGPQNNDTRITSAERGGVGSAIQAKSTGGNLTAGEKFKLMMATGTTSECHNGSVIGGPTSANANGDIGKTSGTIPQRSQGTYEVCFRKSDKTVNTTPDFFTVTK